MMVARTGRPIVSTRLRQKLQPGSSVLLDQYSTSKYSTYFEVVDVPVLLQIFAADDGQTATLYTEINGSEQPFLLDGTPVVLSAAVNAVEITTSGRYRLRLDGNYGPILVSTKQLVGQNTDRDIPQPSGVQANRPNLFFDGDILKTVSSIVEIQSDAWVFSAFGLESTEYITTFAVFGAGISYKEVPLYLNGKAVVLTQSNNAIRLDKTGRYRFKLTGNPASKLLVGNPTFVVNTEGSGGLPGPPGPGVPLGGTTGQKLAKRSNIDYDTQWVDDAAGSGTVTSVTVNGLNGIISSGSPITTTGIITVQLTAAVLASLSLADNAVQPAVLAAHVNNVNNPHNVTKTQVGLGNVDNTSDINKPISTAQAAVFALKANINSPEFTGNPLAPTPATNDNSTSIATTAYVKAQGYTIGGVTSVVGTLPIVSSGGTAPNISINAATPSTAGSMSAVDKTKLDGIADGAQPGTVLSVGATAPIQSTGGNNPNISITVATTSVAGSMSAADKAKLDGIAAGAQPGTVTSVGLSLPNIFNVTESPVTLTGTLTGTLVSQNQNLVFASPNGSAGTPIFRALVANDIPNLAGIYQPLNSALTSISGLTTAVDTGIYTTASNTYTTYALTSAGRALLDDVDSAAQRVTLGLVIGTNVQAYSANLDGWSAISTASKANDNAVVHITGTETITGTKTFTATVTIDATSGSGSVFSVLRPGTSPSGSQVAISSPLGNPGILGQYSTTKRRDIQFADTGIGFAVSTNNSGVAIGLLIDEYHTIQKTGSFVGPDRIVIQGTNTSTAGGSLLTIRLKSGGGATVGTQFADYAPEHTTIAAFAGKTVVENDNSGVTYSALSASGTHTWMTGTGRTVRMSLTNAGALNINTPAQGITMSGVKVLGARITGWNAPTGTQTRGTYDSGALLANTNQTLAALIADLRTHGIIGT